MNRPRLQFRMRTLLLLFPVLCAVLALATFEYRRQQEFRRAWLELALLDMGNTVSTDVRLHSRRTEWDERDVDELLRIIAILERRQNLGFLSGVTIAAIDFKGSQITEESLSRVQRAVPAATVRR